MEIITLYELNVFVREVLHTAMPDRYWVQAELSEVREAAGGHCYLELVQKDTSGRKLIAKARANVWQSVYVLLKPMFERETGRALAPGIKVLLQVEVVFHELYGYSLTVTDIDPSYTLGDMARQRREILRQLEAEGILNDNKSLTLPILANHIAVISSPTAAGYEDFCNQLDENEYGFSFVIRLFPAVMQGERTEQSVLAALDNVLNDTRQWDVVVIIRGGGAVSDLSDFDTYMLAAACAQFPIPIITGIGHERDDTLIDIVAHTRVKTPTAAAAFLIQHQLETAKALESVCQRLQSSVHTIIEAKSTQIKFLTVQIPSLCLRCCDRTSYDFEHLVMLLSNESRHKLSDALQSICNVETTCRAAMSSLLQKEQNKLQLLCQRVVAADPENILKRGYTMTLCDGRIVHCAAELSKGNIITTRFADGEVRSRVE